MAKKRNKFNMAEFKRWAKSKGLKLPSKLKGKEAWTAANQLYFNSEGTTTKFTDKFGYWKENGVSQGYQLKDGKLRLRKNIEQSYIDQAKNKKGKQATTTKRRISLGKQTPDLLEPAYGTARRKFEVAQAAKKFGQELEDHHVIFRNLLEPFYEGLSDSEAKKLTDFLLLELDTPSGNVLANLQALDVKLHQFVEDSVHQWAKENNLQVKPFTKDEWLQGKATNFLDDGTVLGDAGGQVVDTGKVSKHKYLTPELPKNIKVKPASTAKQLYFGAMDGGKFGKYRQKALEEYIGLIKEPLFNKTAEALEIQDVQRLKVDPNYVAKTKKQWLTHFADSAANTVEDAQGLMDAESSLFRRGLKTADPDAFKTARGIRAFVEGPAGKVIAKLPWVGAGVGLLFSGAGLQARQREYDEDPNFLNKVQLDMAKADFVMEGADAASGGTTGLVTLIPQVLMMGGDAAIEYAQGGAKRKEEAQMSQLGEVEKDSNVNNFIGTFHGI